MCVCVCVPHRRAVLHHGVVELVALGGSSREEAALTHVIVKVLQTAIPREKQDNKSNDSVKQIPPFPNLVYAIAIPGPPVITFSLQSLC